MTNFLQNLRTRKCSIVQEEDDEDDVSSCSGRDDHGSNSTLNSFNRRGSRSEGKLSHILQERLAQLPEKHTALKTVHHAHETSAFRDESIKSNKAKDKASTIEQKIHLDRNVISEKNVEKSPLMIKSNQIPNVSPKNKMNTALSMKRTLETQETRPKSMSDHMKSSPTPANKWKMGSQHRAFLSQDESNMQKTDNIHQETMTTILTESSTVPSPLRTITSITDNQVLSPKYKTMPSPTNTKINTKSNPPSQITLKEILEDGDAVTTGTTNLSDSSSSKSRVVRKTGYEQRRSKFHKTRTTSCSSSDASDDDSESRKKRAQKLSGSGKPLPPRRDSHDDSSDSQDPGGSGGSGGGGGGGGLGNGERTRETPSTEPTGNDNSGRGNTGTTSTTGGTHRCSENQGTVFGRRHRAGRRRAGETRLRESQSLNRITEVQEAEAPYHNHSHSHTPRNAGFTQSVVMSPTHIVTTAPIIPQTVTTVQKAKGFGARLLQGWSLGNNKSSLEKTTGFGENMLLFRLNNWVKTLIFV